MHCLHEKEKPAYFLMPAVVMIITSSQLEISCFPVTEIVTVTVTDTVTVTETVTSTVTVTVTLNAVSLVTECSPIALYVP